MADSLSLPSKLDLLDRAELCIAGGGLAGVAAAVTAAEAGIDTVLVEERGALGWEIPHGLEIFLSGQRVPKTLASILEQLKTANATRDGMIDPVATEILLDRVIKASKVRLHLRAFAGGVDAARGIVRVTTKSGPLGIEARAIIDATETSRLAKSAGVSFKPAASATQSRAFLLCAVVPPAAPETFTVDGTSEVQVRSTLWPSEVHVRVSFASKNADRAEADARFAIARTIETLRKAKGEYAQASLSLSAHEGFALAVPQAQLKTLPENLHIAGPSILGRKPTIEERAELGEKAAAAAVEQLRVAAK